MSERILRNDVFVSYARYDDYQQWVTQFVEDLRNEVRVQCGEEVKFWKDDDDLEGRNLHAEIIEEVKNSALLLVVLSPSYLNSDWCREERAHFFRNAGKKGQAQRRTLLVFTHDIARTKLPQDFFDIHAYHFFQKEGQKCKRLGNPFMEETASAYWNAMISLTSDIGDEIALRNRRQTGRKVFLAETDSLPSQRVEVSRRLRQEDYEVLPTDSYEPDGRVSAVEADLKGCALFVQLLGEHGKTLDRQQWEAAQRSKVRSLRWIPKDLNLDNVTDPEHRRMLSGPNIRRTSLEDFKSEIISCLKGCFPQFDPADLEKNSVLIRTAPRDKMLAEQAREALKRKNIKSSVLIGEGSLAGPNVDLVKLGGLMVIFGEERDWASRQLDELCEMIMDRKLPPPPCAAYSSDPDAIFIPNRLRGFHVLPRELETFVGAVLATQ